MEYDDRYRYACACMVRGTCSRDLYSIAGSSRPEPYPYTDREVLIRKTRFRIGLGDASRRNSLPRRYREFAVAPRVASARGPGSRGAALKKLPAGT